MMAVLVFQFFSRDFENDVESFAIMTLTKNFHQLECRSNEKSFHSRGIALCVVMNRFAKDACALLDVGCLFCSRNSPLLRHSGLKERSCALA